MGSTLRMRTRRILGTVALWVTLPSTASAATYYVATSGDDDNAGNMGAPWATLQHAAETVGAGDTVIVLPGSYAGFHLESSGMEGAPIVFSAEEGVEISSENPTTPDGINLEGASHVVVEGFTVNGMERAGLRAVTADHVTFRNNHADANGRWGILTGFVDDLLIEGNFTSGSLEEHGIYVSNSGDRPVIRNNRIWNNNANGIHMNGDAEQGGDGIISDALVERNVIYGNGVAGGSGINCDGVQNSLIVNNLIYDSHASGISLYQIDGGGPSTNNIVINNTVVIANDGRWALNVMDDSSGTTVYNNVFFNLHPSRGAISLCGPGCEADLVSDHNVVIDRFTRDDGTVIDLAAWQSATGQDENSVISDSAAVFVDAAGADYHLTANGPAVDSGTTMSAPAADLEGNARPAGAGVDIGAYEHCGTDCVPAGGAGGTSSMGEGGGGNDAGTSGNPTTGGAGGRGGNATSGGAGTGGASGGTAGTSASGGAGRGGTGGNDAAGGIAGRPTGSGGANAGTTGGAAAGTADEEGGCACRVGRSGNASRFSLFALLALVLFAGRRVGTRAERRR
jgi:MYXO-CTERM domain-containing protein